MVHFDSGGRRRMEGSRAHEAGAGDAGSRERELEYRREYLAEFTPWTEEQSLAFDLWIMFEVDSERFDRTVCTGGSSKHDPEMVLPGNPDEQRLISENARRLKQRTILLARHFGLPQPVLQEAEKNVNRMTMLQRERVYGRAAHGVAKALAKRPIVL